jgi:hypothetical protein
LDSVDDENTGITAEEWKYRNSNQRMETQESWPGDGDKGKIAAGWKFRNSYQRMEIQE